MTLPDACSTHTLLICMPPLLWTCTRCSQQGTRGAPANQHTAIMQVAYRPYSGPRGSRHTHTFTFPPIDRQKLAAESERIDSGRREEFKRAMPDELALQHWAGGFGAFKQSLPVRSSGPLPRALPPWTLLPGCNMHSTCPYGSACIDGPYGSACINVTPGQTVTPSVHPPQGSATLTPVVLLTPVLLR